MIEFILEMIPYVKRIKEANEKNEVIIAVKENIIEDLEMEIEELKDKIVSFNSLKRRLAKIDNEYQKSELEKGNLIIENDKLKKENQKLENELKYYKKSLKRVYQGNNHISIIASRVNKKD